MKTYNEIIEKILEMTGKRSVRIFLSLFGAFVMGIAMGGLLGEFANSIFILLANLVILVAITCMLNKDNDVED